MPEGYTLYVGFLRLKPQSYPFDSDTDTDSDADWTRFQGRTVGSGKFERRMANKLRTPQHFILERALQPVRNAG